MPRRVNPVFRSLNSPLTLLGAERKLFFVALMMGAGVFNLLHTLFGGILMFALLYLFARWATKTDPEILRLVLNSAKARQQYDPLKFVPVLVEVVRHA
jgi:type IV secretory pathway TrbD component